MKVNQLINFFVPEKYHLLLYIDRKNRQFSGEVSILGKRISNDPMRLHAKDLEVLDVFVNDEIVIPEFAENDEVILNSEAPLNQEITVSVAFKGRITDGAMHGLYPCFYEVDGERKELLATQFESHHAREVFPCIDEPAAKATFDLTLVTEKTVTVLANTPITDDTQGPFTLSELKSDQQVTAFETTPKMSTYLLAFVIGDLQKVSARTKGDVEVNIFATPAQDKKSLAFALDVATKCIDFYEDYFATKYPLPKSDHVALPDFSSGAMENWGLITYRENCLLADDNTALASKQYIATVIAHELSHQWFGNLVTMKWWDDLWLNESFATLMEHISIDALWPEWNIWSSFETGDVVSALRRDCLPGVQTVKQDVAHPDEISTLFDSAIVYAKGGRLLKMVRAFVGEAVFRDGLRQYFSKFAYKNTSGADLWSCLSDVSGQDVSMLMNAWLTRPGYPVLNAVRNEDGSITLTQSRFLIDGNSDDVNENPWPIPLFASDQGAPKLLAESSISFKPTSNKVFKLNVGNNAHFITNYDDKLRADVLEKIDTFGEFDRLQILNEATLLARGNRMNTAGIIDMVTAFRYETSEAVWSAISYAISDLRRFIEGDNDATKNLRGLVADISEDLYKKLGWTPREGESQNDTKLRPMIIGNMLFAENTEAIAAALKLYVDNKHNLKGLDGNVRELAMLAAVKFGQETDFHELMDLYKTTQDADLQLDLCGALTASRRVNDIQEMLAMQTNAEIVRPQDVFYWFAFLLSRYEARGLTWSWMTDNWSWIEETFGGDKSYDLFPRYAGARLMTRGELNEFHKFFTPLINQPALQRAIEVGESDITARVTWIERDKDFVIARLSDL